MRRRRLRYLEPLLSSQEGGLGGMATSAQRHKLVCAYIELKIRKKLCSKTINVPNARTSTSMRARKDPSQSQHLKQDTIRSHRECLVQVHMTDITPTCRRVSQTDLRIQVRTYTKANHQAQSTQLVKRFIPSRYTCPQFS